MIELTPVDVRKKKGDFRRGIRGYEPQHVDEFLDVVADRMETLVREHHAIVERTARLDEQLAAYRDREKALTDALVTAQTLRDDVRAQCEREGEVLIRQAEQDAARIQTEANQIRVREEQALHALRARQLQFLAGYRAFLEQELNELTAYGKAIELQQASAASQAAPASASHGSARPGSTRPQPGPAVEAREPFAALARSLASGPTSPPPAPPTPDRRSARSEADRPAAATHAAHTSMMSVTGPMTDDELDARVAAAFLEIAGAEMNARSDDPAELLLSDEDVVAAAHYHEDADDVTTEYDDFDDVDLETPLFGVPEDPWFGAGQAGDVAADHASGTGAGDASVDHGGDDGSVDHGGDDASVDQGADEDQLLFGDDDSSWQAELARAASTREDDAWSDSDRPEPSASQRGIGGEAVTSEPRVPDAVDEATFDDVPPDEHEEVVVASEPARDQAVGQGRPDISVAFGDHAPDDDLIDLDTFEGLRNLAERDEEPGESPAQPGFLRSLGLTLRDAFGSPSREGSSGEGEGSSKKP